MTEKLLKVNILILPLQLKNELLRGPPTETFLVIVMTTDLHLATKFRFLG